MNVEYVCIGRGLTDHTWANVAVAPRQVSFIIGGYKPSGRPDCEARRGMRIAS